jgi:hypothetical protein
MVIIVIYFLIISKIFLLENVIMSNFIVKSDNFHEFPDEMILILMLLLVYPKIQNYESSIIHSGSVTFTFSIGGVLFFGYPNLNQQDESLEGFYFSPSRLDILSNENRVANACVCLNYAKHSRLHTPYLTTVTFRPALTFPALSFAVIYRTVPFF